LTRRKMKKIRSFAKNILTEIWSNIGRAYKRTKNFLWDHRQGIQLIVTPVSLVLLIIAVWISYRTLQESQEFGSTMIAQMDTLSALFAKVNEQISFLPTSVSRFDSTVRGLDEGISNQQEEFQRSISGLQRNIDRFSKGIADYGKSLAEIVEASDKQLALLDERQKLLEKELMSRPRLVLRVKECRKDTLGRLIIAPEILNIGDATADYCRILIEVPEEFEFASGGFKVYDSTKRIQTWSYNVSSFIGYSSKKKRYPVLSNPRMEFSIRILLRPDPAYQLNYVIYHNKGMDEDTLRINLVDCD
jgi:hypothetical protein